MQRRNSFLAPYFACRSWLLAIAAGLLFALPAEAQQPNEALQAHLRAGEFARAQAMIQELPAEQRNAWLARMAQVQARSAARSGARRSLGAINDPDLRGAAAAGLRQQSPMGLFGEGGMMQADFDTLIELIETTTARGIDQGWEEVDGGPGTIREFPSGVYVDPQGNLKRIEMTTQAGELAELRREAQAQRHFGDVRSHSPLRKVSLPRLERALEARWALGERPTEAMQNMAGLTRIEYIFVFPETGDVVVAGPAGNWHRDIEGRVVNPDSNHPVVQLDDLLVVLRHAVQSNEPFGCSIDPRDENLANTKRFLDEWADKAVPPGQRSRWLEQLGEVLGKQDVTVFGIDPRTRAAQVLVEADYRMKLVGMGLEEGTLGVNSYLDAMAKDGAQTAPMSLLRWWFTLNYQGIETTETRDAYHLTGQGVRLLSENEWLKESGRRVASGHSDPYATQFAAGFTKHFEALAEKYPLYAEMRNIFDLALVSTLLAQEDLPAQVGWQLSFLLDAERCPVQLNDPPRQVDTVVAHRVINQRRFVASASGGVRVDARGFFQSAPIQATSDSQLQSHLSGARPQEFDAEQWWWD